MKIAIIYNNFAHKGGAENVIFWLIKGLKADGHQVSLITRYYSPDLWGSRMEFPCAVKVVRAKNVSKYIRSLVMPFLIYRHLRDADIINPHNYPASVWSALCKKLFRLKGRLISFCQEPDRIIHEPGYRTLGAGTISDRPAPGWLLSKHFLHERRLDLWAARQMDRILVNSRFSKTMVDTVLNKQTTVCLLGEPLTKVCHPEAGSRERTYFLVLGRLHAAKNVETVLKAYKALHEARKGSVPPLVVAGQGAFLQDYRQWAKEQGLEDKINFKGFFRDDEIPDLMSGAIALLFVPFQEPFGLVTVEAFVNETPAIVSDEGGPAEVVADGKTGFLVKPRDVKGLCDKMNWFLENPQEGRAMGKVAALEAKSKYSQESFIARFLEACRASLQTGLS